MDTRRAPPTGPWWTHCLLAGDEEWTTPVHPLTHFRLATTVAQDRSLRPSDGNTRKRMRLGGHRRAPGTGAGGLTLRRSRPRRALRSRSLMRWPLSTVCVCVSSVVCRPSAVRWVLRIRAARGAPRDAYSPPCLESRAAGLAGPSLSTSPRNLDVRSGVAPHGAASRTRRAATRSLRAGCALRSRPLPAGLPALLVVVVLPAVG